MGTWNAKPFGNDTAGDWLFELEPAKDEGVISEALEAVVKGDYPEAAESERAIAAAAVVLAARAEPVRGVPKEAKMWITERGFVASNELVKKSIRAVERISAKSELKELWEEAGSLRSWQKGMDQLTAGLEKALKSPLPQRKPRAPGVPRLLCKLIAAVRPEEETPLRQKLKEKLAALADVNAPLPGSYEETPLHIVAGQGLIPEAELLLKRGAKIEGESGGKIFGQRTPLEKACKAGRAEMVDFLLKRGASIMKEVVLPAVPLIRDEPEVVRFPSALFHAVRAGSIATVDVLMGHGADLHFTEGNGDTLLHKAAEEGREEMIRFLAGQGVKLNARGSCGYTPLHLAAMRIKVEPVAELLRLGADRNVKDDEGSTPLDVVIDENGEIARLLRGGGDGKA